MDDEWFMLLISDQKQKTTDLGSSPDTHLKCQGFQTHTQGLGFH